MKIVIVEDEGITALFLQETIEECSHEVVGVFDEGNALLIFLEDNEVDLIFMDININGVLDGIQVADLVYHKYQHIFFVFLTSYKDSHTIESARVVRPIGYLIKPVLEKDIEAILMVSEGYKDKFEIENINDVHIGEYIYNIENAMICRSGEFIALSKNEHRCLRELILHRGTQVSIEQLLFSIWGEDENRLPSLRELTYRLRKKLPGVHIDNIPNVGYILRTD